MQDAWRHLDYPALVAHRGYAARYPENTVIALAAAVSCGARFLEFDIQLSRDGIPILCHDESLTRVAGINQSVFDQDWQDLRGVHVGETDRLGSRFATLPIASLKDAVAHLNRWPATVSFVEVKRQTVARFGVEFCVDRILSCLAHARWPSVIISFDATVVAYANAKGVLTGWVLRQWDDDHRTRLAKLNPDYVFCNADKVPAKEPLWPGGWHWVVYEITTPAQATYWRTRGAVLIESMTPGELLGAPPFSEAEEQSA